MKRLRRPLLATSAFLSVWLFVWLLNAAYVWGLPCIALWPGIVRGLVMCSALIAFIFVMIIPLESDQ